MQAITTNITHIVLDFGAVLININYQLTIDAFKKIGITNFDELYSKAQQTNLFNDLEMGLISDIDFYNQLRSISGVELSYLAIQTAWNAMLINLPKQRMELVYKLKQKYKVYLLSNTNCIHEQAFMQHIRATIGQDYFYNAFDKVFYSHQIGLRKPNATIFDYVQKHINAQGSAILFVDDSLQHIVGAKAFGWNAYHLQDNEEITTVLAV
jgi:glucose-1-phosphatase